MEKFKNWLINNNVNNNIINTDDKNILIGYMLEYIRQNKEIKDFNNQSRYIEEVRDYLGGLTYSDDIYYNLFNIIKILDSE